MAVHDWLADLAKLIRNVDRPLTAEAKHGQAIEKLATEIGTPKERVTRLEAREDIIIAEARSAAVRLWLKSPSHPSRTSRAA